MCAKGSPPIVIAELGRPREVGLRRLARPVLLREEDLLLRPVASPATPSPAAAASAAARRGTRPACAPRRSSNSVLASKPGASRSIASSAGQSSSNGSSRVRYVRRSPRSLGSRPLERCRRRRVAVHARLHGGLPDAVARVHGHEQPPDLSVARAHQGASETGENPQSRRPDPHSPGGIRCTVLVVVTPAKPPRAACTVLVVVTRRSRLALSMHRSNCRSAAHRRLDRCAKRLAAAKARALRLSPEDAEDAAQHVCVIALSNDGAALSRVTRDDTTLSAWVAGVLDHVLKDLVTARAPTKSATPVARASKRGAQRARAAAERTARLGPAGWGRLNELTPSRLHAYRLHLQGLSNSEISARLGASRNATRLRIRGACSQLKTKPDHALAPVSPPSLLTEGLC